MGSKMPFSIKVIVVSPKYQINLGYIARVCKNFGVKELSIVKPRAKLNGNKSIMFAKHAYDLLANAHLYNSIEDAASGCSIIIGTTGIWRVRSKVRFMELNDAVKLVRSKYRNSTIALLIGRDDTGLRKSELEACDFAVHISTSRSYPVLNISHAIGILLYAFGGKSTYPSSASKQPAAAEKEELFNAFDKLTEGKKIRDRRMTQNIFRSMVRRADLNKEELHAMITALK